MQGIEEARLFYTETLAPAIRKELPQYEGRIAAGLVGHGSECFGFDDAVSRDHDFDTGVCLWLTEEDDVAVGVQLQRLYNLLAPETTAQRSALGSNGHGVRTIGDFYLHYTGRRGAPAFWEEWLSLPSWALAEATNGEVFRDDLGEFTKVRKLILTGMPEDVRKKKIAARLAMMAQTGQYNYERCLKHGERGAAALALDEFVRNAAELWFLLEKRHMPYYKWAFRAMRALEGGESMRTRLEGLLLGDDDAEGSRRKLAAVESIAEDVVERLEEQELTFAEGTYLEPHALAVMQTIENQDIAALHVMEG